jgi:hypothetical protein
LHTVGTFHHCGVTERLFTFIAAGQLVLLA